MQAIIYMWQVSACMAIFYGFYYFLLRRFTFFTLNRWYLMVTLLVSFIIPAITITVHEQSAPAVIQKVVLVNQHLPTSGFEIAAPIKAAGPAIDWIAIVELAYLIITAVLLLKLIITIARFFYNIKSASVSKIGRVRIIKGDKNISNGSFFNYILLADDTLNQLEAQQVVDHELLHVKLYHSADRVLVKLVQIVLWFNPFVYRYARAIEENHEFEVDSEIGKRANKNNYADMLLHLSINQQDVLFNSFSKVPLKRRIAMLFTKPTNHMKKITYLLILPVVMISCLAFARFKNDVKKNGAGTLSFAKFKNEVKAVKNSLVKTLHLTPAEPERYSAIPNVDLMLGSTSEIILVIDGKTYDKEIAYKISANCIKNVVILPMPTTTNVAGGATANSPVQLYDGKFAGAKIVVKTFNGQIKYMTALERENLVKEREASSVAQFYSRVHLTDNKGKAYDKAIVSNLRSSVTITVSSKEKVLFSIDGVYYNENDIRFIDQRKLSEIMVTGKISARPVPMTPGEFAKGIGALFTIETKPLKYADDTTRKAAPPAAKLESPFKTDDTDDENTTTASEKRVVSRAMENPATPFFSRFHFVRNGNNGLDVIAFKIGAHGGTANLGADDKAGAFIDGKFCNEDALKKITADIATKLEFDGAPDRSKREKYPEGNYAMPFSFKTKTARSAADTTKDK